MDQKSPSLISIFAWFVAIPVVNAILLFSYVQAQPPEPFWTMLWNYLETDVFKLITGSLIIPLLFSILEKRYKFMEGIQRRREDRRKQLEEQRSKNRQEAIRDTLNMWQKLFDLTAAIIFFDPQKDDRQMLKPIIMELNQFSSSAEHIVNKWTHQFPNLKPEDHDVFLYFINLLYHSGQTTIYNIREEVNPQEVKILQDALFQIQDQVKNVLNQTITDVLKYSTRLLEIKENSDVTADSSQIEKQINNYLALLRDWRTALKELDKQHDNFLSTAQGQQVDELRKTAQDVGAWLKEDESRFIYQSPQFNLLKDQFYNIPMADRIAILRIPYTKEYLFALADWLSFESACLYLYDRVHNRW